MAKILLIGNDKGTASRLAGVLEGGLFHIDCAFSEAEAFKALARSEPDLVLIAMVRPDSTVPQLCERVRRLIGAPIVVCSNSGREHDVVRALEAGADDYLALPIRPVEVVARLRALLRRASEKEAASTNGRHLIAGDLELRLEEHEVTRGGVALDLSPIEFKLLALLVRETGRAVSHSRLIAHVWGPEYVDCRHYLRLYVRYLRSKLEDNPRNPERILNEWGVGYRFEPKAA